METTGKLISKSHQTVSIFPFCGMGRDTGIYIQNIEQKERTFHKIISREYIAYCGLGPPQRKYLSCVTRE